MSCFTKLDLARLWGRVKMWSDTLQWWTVRLGMWQCILVAAGVFVGVEVMCRCWYVSIMCFMLMLKVWAMSILHCCLGSRPCSQALSHYPVDYELGTYGRQDFDSGCWFQDSPNILNPETLLVCLLTLFFVGMTSNIFMILPNKIPPHPHTPTPPKATSKLKGWCWTSPVLFQ